MAVEWTTATIVRQSLKGAGTSLTDAEIENFIEQNEGFMETVLKIPASFAYNSALKPHRFLQKLVTVMTAIDVLASTPQSFNTFTSIDAASKILVYQYENMIKFLADQPSYRDFIINAEG